MSINDPYKTKETRDNTVDPRVVADFHRHSDLDRDTFAQHHSLGPGANQAAAGTHSHDGTNTRQLGVGITLTGAKGGNAALTSVIAAMVQILGVEDNTT